MKKAPIGVAKMIKDSAITSELKTSLQPLSVSPMVNTVTKNASVMESETPSINIHKIKSSYYNFYN